MNSYLDLESMYQEVILDEAKEKYGFTDEFEQKFASHQYNPSCGDDLTVLANVNPDNNTVNDVIWNGSGCSISIASASIMSKLIKDIPIEKANNLISNFKELMDSRGCEIESEKMDLLGDANVFVGTAKFPARIKCCLLAWVALEESLLLQING